MARQPEPSASDLYARLGVAADASRTQIDAAYRRLAIALHPDSAESPGGSPTELQLVIEAHRTLSNSRHRERYDSTASRALHADRSRSNAVATNACAVCRGTGTIAYPCHRCAGSGHVLTGSPWLRTPSVCPDCRTRRYMMCICGTCGGTGRTLVPAARERRSRG
jgi:DnaJ-class molecular chaperone